MKFQFSNNLEQRTIAYFKERYGRELTEQEAQEALETLSNLYALFSDDEPEPILGPPDST